MDTETKYFLIVIILGILQASIIYSVGRTHGSSFKLYIPNIREWATIAILLVVLYVIGGALTYSIFKNDIKHLELEKSY
jgi:putative Mn2+ efflux pump MntP